MTRLYKQDDIRPAVPTPTGGHHFLCEVCKRSTLQNFYMKEEKLAQKCTNCHTEFLYIFVAGTWMPEEMTDIFDTTIDRLFSSVVRPPVLPSPADEQRKPAGAGTAGVSTDQPKSKKPFKYYLELAHGDHIKAHELWMRDQ